MFKKMGDNSAGTSNILQLPESARQMRSPERQGGDVVQEEENSGEENEGEENLIEEEKEDLVEGENKDLIGGENADLDPNVADGSRAVNEAAVTEDVLELICFVFIKTKKDVMFILQGVAAVKRERVPVSYAPL